MVRLPTHAVLAAGQIQVVLDGPELVGIDVDAQAMPAKVEGQHVDAPLFAVPRPGLTQFFLRLSSPRACSSSTTGAFCLLLAKNLPCNSTPSTVLKANLFRLGNFGFLFFFLGAGPMGKASSPQQVRISER